LSSAVADASLNVTFAAYRRFRTMRRPAALFTTAASCVVMAACTDEQGDAATTSAGAPSSPPHSQLGRREVERRQTGGYRIIGKPAAIILDAAFPDEPPMNVYIRLTKALPRRGSEIFGTLTFGGVGGGSGLVRIGRKSRHCYAQGIDFRLKEVAEPRPGVTATMRLRIRGVRLPLVVPVRLRAQRDLDRVYRPLRCGRGGFDPQP
jgi:hypothetical protein